jgi:hypothetical protein
LLEGDMLLTLPYDRSDPIFGMDATGSLYLAIITPILNIGSHCDEIDSYRLEANDMTFTIHTPYMNQFLAYYHIHRVTKLG